MDYDFVIMIDSIYYYSINYVVIAINYVNDSIVKAIILVWKRKVDHSYLIIQSMVAMDSKTPTFHVWYDLDYGMVVDVSS